MEINLKKKQQNENKDSVAIAFLFKQTRFNSKQIKEENVILWRVKRSATD